MSSTKQKILDAAIPLFCDEGLANVRLQQIADAAGISVGNLAYHYHSKKAIVEAISREIDQSIGPVISEKHIFPNLLDFDVQLARYYHFLMKYSFYFVDLMELQRAYPKLYDRQQAYTGRIIEQVENWFHYNVEAGRMKPEIRPRQYHILAHTIWMILSFWMACPPDHGFFLDGERSFKEAIWTQALPNFTPQGRLEFELTVERLLDTYFPGKLKY